MTEDELLAAWKRGEVVVTTGCDLDPEEPQTFERELERLINRHCIENESDTPDFTLAQYLRGCLDAFNAAVKRRDDWYGYKPWASREEPLPAPGDTECRCHCEGCMYSGHCSVNYTGCNVQ